MAVRELEVRLTEADGVAVMDLVGELDSTAETALQDAFARAIESGPRPVQLNFAETDYINSTGIALIVSLLGQARSRGIEVRASGLSDHYREIFEITRLADFMTIVDNTGSAGSGAEGNDHG